MSKYKSEKPKAAIKYGQSRDTGNFGLTRNRTRTTQTAKNMTNTDPTKKTWSEHSCSCRVCDSSVL
jgi:hypothetical protein